jgi:hypothetical protein
LRYCNEINWNLPGDSRVSQDAKNPILIDTPE